MVQNQIRSLFLLFAGEEELPDAVQPVLDEAVLEVQQALKDGADEDDARLNWLAAAVAFLRYTEITAARDRAACTFAGTIAQNTDAAQKLEFAGLLVQAYRRLCRSLLEDETFLFQAVLGFFVKCTFWGSRVETVRRSSLVPRCPPWACRHRGRRTVVRRWWGSS